MPKVCCLRSSATLRALALCRRRALVLVAVSLTLPLAT
eukprot:COSAG04_NODE_31065_length_259_cov_0.543750_1_plen_37_part_10